MSTEFRGHPSIESNAWCLYINYPLKYHVTCTSLWYSLTYWYSVLYKMLRSSLECAKSNCLRDFYVLKWNFLNICPPANTNIGGREVMRELLIWLSLKDRDDKCTIIIQTWKIKKALGEFLKEWRRRGSNPRSSVCETDALLHPPLCYIFNGS